MEANQLVNAAPGWIRSFDEWLTGLCHGIEVFCRLREGVLVSIMQEVLLGMAEAFKTVESGVQFRFCVSVIYKDCRVRCDPVHRIDSFSAGNGRAAREALAFRFPQGVFAAAPASDSDRERVA